MKLSQQVKLSFIRQCLRDTADMIKDDMSSYDAYDARSKVEYCSEFLEDLYESLCDEE